MISFLSVSLAVMLAVLRGLFPHYISAYVWLPIILFLLNPFFADFVIRKRCREIAKTKERIEEEHIEWQILGTRITPAHTVRKIISKDRTLLIEYHTCFEPLASVYDEGVRIRWKNQELVAFFKDGKVGCTIEAGRKFPYIPPPGPNYEWAYAARCIAVNMTRYTRKVKRQSA